MVYLVYIFCKFQTTAKKKNLHFLCKTFYFTDLLRQFGTETFVKGPLMTLEVSICLMRGLSSVFYEKGQRNSYCQATGNEKGEEGLDTVLASTTTASVVSSSSPVLRHVLVLDLRGLALAQVLDTGVIRLLTQLASLHEAHYPETLGEAVLISSRQTAYITRMALSLVKPFLAERTRAKIKLVSDGPDLQQQLATGTLRIRNRIFTWIENVSIRYGRLLTV